MGRDSRHGQRGYGVLPVPVALAVAVAVMGCLPGCTASSPSPVSSPQTSSPQTSSPQTSSPQTSSTAASTPGHASTSTSGSGLPAASTTATKPPTPSQATPATGTAETTYPPPYISSVRWVRTSSGRSLHVFPTISGRNATGPDDGDEAWAEVLRLAPDAGTPGMRAQFDCHWTYARLVAPDKHSWNLEPWRPVVGAQAMTRAGCNPGGGDEG